jgi:hypothetical protein
MRALVLAMSVGSFLLAVPARADPGPPRRFDVAASFGYAFPVGSSEQGAALGDVTFGNVPIDLTAAYRLSRRFALGISGRYGFVIPTLCGDSSECISSLGHDVAIQVRARFFLPPLLGAEPYADAGLGYEWFASKLVDTGKTSTHTYDGPVFFSGEIGVPFELGSRWTLGPALALALGTFVHSHLDAPGVSRDLGVSDPGVHAWLSLAVRASFRF